MPSRAERRGAPARLWALILACAVAALPVRAWSAPADAAAEAAAPATDAARADGDRRIAVVITQSVGVGALADRLAAIASAAVGKGGATVLDPVEAGQALRAAAGPDPLTCGSDASCLRAIADALDARWVLGIGIGRFGGIYGLELRLVDRRSDLAAAESGTWAEPGPDWEVALREELAAILPPDLLAPPRGRLLVRSNEAGELFVDGEAVATLPLEKPLELAPGPHRLELRGASGSATGEVTIRADSLAEVELVLAPAIAEAPHRWMRTGSYVAGGAAVAALAAAIATHLDASRTMDDARDLKAEGKPFASTRSDALDTIGTSRLLYGVAAGLAAGAVTLYLLDRPAERQPAAP